MYQSTPEAIEHVVLCTCVVEFANIATILREIFGNLAQCIVYEASCAGDVRTTIIIAIIM